MKMMAQLYFSNVCHYLVGSKGTITKIIPASNAYTTIQEEIPG